MRVLAVLALFAAATAAADDLVLLGLPFGKPLDRDIRQCDTSPQAGEYCAVLQEFRKGSNVSSLQLRRPSFANPEPLGLPDWVQIKGTVSVYFDGGVITKITAPTGGPGRQSAVIEAVSARFGEPSSKVDRTARNAYGATWSVSSVRWESQGVIATHGCSGLDYCLLVISTPEREAAEMKAMQERKLKNAL